LKIYSLSELSKQELEKLCQRNQTEDAIVEDVVSDIILKVKAEGDDAICKLSEQYDKVKLDRLWVGKSEIDEAAAIIPERSKQAIDQAYKNIKLFHQSQVRTEAPVETMPGVTCWRESRAIDRVGLYIPGGSAVLPSTFLMLGIPARIAGCKEIVVCSPPQKDGKINGYIAYVAQLLNIDRIYLAGGAQAIAAMAFGTVSIPKVDKIFGPGNQYVTQAKIQIQTQSITAIDMPAGPSEVLIIADETANPAFVAADLLAQAEHGADSQVVLITTSEAFAGDMADELANQIVQLPRMEIAALSMYKSFTLLASNMEEAVTFSNQYAPEHLILAVKDPEALIPSISNAGSVFVGHLTPESAGDYASGTNHTLPTNAYSKAYSGVSTDAFVKKITFQRIDKTGLQNIGETVEILADMEGLEGHKQAVSIRLKSLKN